MSADGVINVESLIKALPPDFAKLVEATVRKCATLGKRILFLLFKNYLILSRLVFKLEAILATTLMLSINASATTIQW